MHEHLIRYAGDFVDVVIEHASGTVLHATDGRQILDFTSGQMCATLGHNHPAITAAVEQACREVTHLFSGMLSPPVLDLARELADMLPDPLDKVMLLNTGAESNEAALRLAKLTTGGFEVLAFTGSWHGMTAGASSSTYSGGHQGYGPALPGTMALPTPNCYRCPIRHCVDRCDLTCLDVGMELADSQSVGSYAAVVVEPILSAGGIIPLPDGYLDTLAAHCRARGMVLIVDEAQTAFGRVGANFAFERHGVVPDMVTVSKTLGGGLPLSATVVDPEVEQAAYERGFLHFTSHQSDPLPAMVGLAVLRTLAAEQLNERARHSGERLRAGLDELAGRHEAIGDVRGEGLLLGVEVVKDRDTREPDEQLGTAVTSRCLELGLNVNIVKFRGFGSVFRIAPPLTVTTEELDRGIEILDRALTECA
ncbi:MAG: aspartate aminotransferase family protein [Actinobacteria bacterium]|nr:aspartate aminotransferase family protein [Actinomycetota bacterium]